MTLRLSSITLVGLLLPGLASAAGDAFTVYGVLDTGLAHVEHSLNFDPYHPVGVIPYASAPARSGATGMFNGGLSPSRLGFKGQEDLGEGRSAVFALEAGINVQSGQLSNALASLANNRASGPNMSADSAMSGQFFSRQAWLGLKDDEWGQISLGRHTSFFVDDILRFDPMKGSQIFSPIGFSGTYAGGGDSEDSRTDNSLKYIGKFGDWQLGGLYKFGGVAGAGNAQSSYQFNVLYEQPLWSAVAGVQHFDDAFAASNSTTAGDVTATVANTQAYFLSGLLKLEPVVVKLGYEREQFSNPSHAANDHITTLYGYPVSAVTVNAYGIHKDLNVYWTGVEYDWSQALSVTAAYYLVDQNDYSGNGCNAASSKCAGRSRFASLMSDYRLSKRTDVYAGWMANGVTGGLGYGFAYRSNHILGTGLRMSF